MRWGRRRSKVVRPLHSILCLFDNNPIKFSIEDIHSNNSTFGHRFVSPNNLNH